MVNLDKVQAMWLVSDDQVVYEFCKSVETTRMLYSSYYDLVDRSNSGYKISASFIRGITFGAWTKVDVELLLQSTFRGGAASSRGY